MVKKKDYSDCFATLKASDYVEKLKKEFKAGRLTHADVSIVFNNKSGTGMKWGKALPQPPK